VSQCWCSSNRVVGRSIVSSLKANHMHIMKTHCTWLSLVFLALASLPAIAAGSKPGFDTIGIESFLAEHIDNDRGFGMVVGLVSERGTQIISYGTLGNETDDEVNGDTIFEIGSATKTFTSLLLLEMADRGEVSVDDPVAKYLPDTVTMPSYQGYEVTLLNLAAQNSGLPFNADNHVGSDWQVRFETYTAPMMYEFLSGHQLTQAPGSEFQYSNIGMGLLGHALTRRAGVEFESLVVERICRPLGMDSTLITIAPELQGRMAIGHDDAGEPTANYYLPAIPGAGALRSTANDLTKYVSAQLDLTHSHLTPLMQRTHAVRHVDACVRDQFRGKTALPWFDEGVYMPPGSRLLGHSGGTGGFNSFVGLDLGRRRGVVVLTNQSEIHSSMLGWRILQDARLNGLDAKRMMPMRELVGSGIMWELDDEIESPRIIGTVPGSPAADALLQSGLVVQSINGRTTKGKSLTECHDLIRGPAGTKMRLELVDPQSNHKTTVELTWRKFMLES
jgi:serine-type D-Ala-D-Ala carboxypeptidase/endopeptidase